MTHLPYGRQAAPRIPNSWAALLLLLCLLARGAKAQPATGEDGTAGQPAGAEVLPGAPRVEVVLRKLSLEHLRADHADLSAVLEITPTVAATLQHVRFRGIRLDGTTPVFLDALNGRFVLRRGVPLVLHQARVSIFYADLPAPTVLDSMVQAHQVRLTGEVRADLELSLMGRLAARDVHPVAALSLDQTVPFDSTTVDSTTELGTGLLALAERTAGVGNSILDRVAGVHVALHEPPVDARLLRSLVQVRTTFRLGNGKRRIAGSCVRLGFRVGDDEVLVPAEVLEPWAYSLELAAVMNADGLKAESPSLETSVLPLEGSGRPAAQGWSFAHGDLAVVRLGNPETTRLLLPAGRSVNVRERESQENFALLKLSSTNGKPLPEATGPAAVSGGLMALRRSPGQDPVLRLVEVGRLTDAGEPTRPFDESFFGSPLLLDGGVTGMIAGEHTVVPLTSVASLATLRREPAGPHGRPASGFGSASSSEQVRP